MDLLIAFERCVQEDRFLPATYRFLQRADSTQFLRSIGRDLHSMPPAGSHEVELRFLETLAQTIGLEIVCKACIDFQAYAERREEQRREAILKAEQAAAELLLRSTIL